MFLCFFIWNVQLIKCFWSFVFCRDEALLIREIIQFIANYTNLQVAKHPVGIESPVQEPHLSSSLSPVRTESLGIESPVQEPDSSQSRVGIESTVQEAQLSSSPSGNGYLLPVLCIHYRFLFFLIPITTHPYRLDILYTDMHIW
jgi:hypothetical protein